MKKFKLLSIFLAFVLVFSVFPFNVVYAVEGTEISDTQKTEEFALPDIVPEEEATEREYIGRVKEEEKDNYTFVFKDSENTRTMRVYSHPVKYTDKDGNTKDITLDIQSRPGGGFETKDNSIKTTFGAKLSDGIRLQSEDVDIKLIPANSLNQATLSEDNKTVSYTLDAKTTLEYSLTYTGFKEDIVVNEYTGQTEYEFLLYTNGLTVKEEMGSFYLADSEGNRKANIGDIIIFTADERNNTLGELSCIEIKENQIYGLTIHVDAEYLKDEKTVYPIRIDPTLEVTGAGAIEDVTVYTGTSYYSGTSGILYVGKSNDNKQYRALMRFPGLEIPVDFPEMITSAKIELRDVMCQGTHVPIICTPYPVIAAGWSEATTSTWNNTQQYYTSNKVLDEQVVYYGNGNVPGISQRYAFNITEEARNWARGSSTPDRGVVFRMSDSFAAQTPSTTQDELKYFGSYNRSDYQPSLTIEYSNIIAFVISKTDSNVKYLTAKSLSAGGASMCSTTDLFSMSCAEYTKNESTEEERKYLSDDYVFDPEYYGKTMWAFEYFPASDTYRISTMGLRYQHGQYDSSLYISGTTAGIAMNYLSGNYTMFYLEEHNGQYAFKNRATGLYLSVGSSNVITTSSARTGSTLFDLTCIETETFSHMFRDKYAAGVYDGVAHIKLVLSEAVENSILFSDCDFTSAKWWNGITDKIVIYAPDDTVPAGITPFYVYIKIDGEDGECYIGGNTFAIYFPNVIGADVSYAEIYLNDHVGTNNNPFYELIDDPEQLELMIEHTICHEMGHVLKMSHTYENPDSIFNHFCEDARLAYPLKNVAVLSVMNYGIIFDVDKNWLATLKPSYHDKLTLISRWECHYDCEN